MYYSVYIFNIINSIDNIKIIINLNKLINFFSILKFYYCILGYRLNLYYTYRVINYKIQISIYKYKAYITY